MWEKEKYYRSKLIKRILVFIISFVFYTQVSFSSPKKNIIDNLSKTNNLSFDFIQQIEEKVEIGKCKIQYSNLIYCLYDNKDKKEMVSNGRSLVIKNNRYNSTYIYPLKTTPLKYILDKEFILNEIRKLKPEKKNNDKIEFLLTNEAKSIKIFFDKKSYDLIGWEMIDIYQNKVNFQISNIKKNILIDKNQFKLPKLN